MAEITFAFGTSHGPSLLLPPERWVRSKAADMVEIKEFEFRGHIYSYDELLELRRNDYLVEQNTLTGRQALSARCHSALDEISRRLSAAAPDVLIIMGDDHMEFFKADIQPPFAVYCGDSIVNRGVDSVDPAKLNDDLSIIFNGYQPARDQDYACEPQLAHAITEQAADDGLDVTVCAHEPQGPNGKRGIGHFIGFIYQRILNASVSPTTQTVVPVLLNTYFPPNQPRVNRCFELGRSIGRAVAAWDSDKTVGIVASGGLSHFAIDEEMDQAVLQAVGKRDVETLLAIPESTFVSGTSEIKNWVTALGALLDTKLEMDVLDYVPCYRSEAGTGFGAAFATWS